METKLKGKRALITGGATGIGLGISTALAREGVEVTVASRHPESAGLERLREIGARVHSIQADVSTEEGATGMVREAIGLMGGLDMYINNAAMVIRESVTKLTRASLEQVLNTNLLGAVYATREAARHFIANGSGGILIVGSTSRLTPCYGETAYRISKTSLKILMEQLSLELAPFGIRVNLLTPGHFPTKLTAHVDSVIESKLIREIPLRRFGDPMDEVGPSAVMLLSEAISPYTTGTEVIIDGGLSLRPINFNTDEELLALNGR